MVERMVSCFYSHDDGGYIAVVPGLETLSAFGESVETAVAELERVLRAAEIPTSEPVTETYVESRRKETASSGNAWVPATSLTWFPGLAVTASA